MFKRISFIALVVFGPTASADQWDPIINMAVKQLEMSGELSGIAGCVGVSEAKFVKEYKPVLRSCLTQFGVAGQSEENEAKMDKCFETEMVKRFNVSESQLLSCKEQFANDDESDEDGYSDDEYADDENYAEDDIDYSQLSDEEYAALMEKQQQESKEQLEMMLSVSKAASKGTEHLITLPVYQQSEIMSHFSEGVQIGDGDLRLPVAMFSSADSVEKIKAYYASKLPNFKSKTFDGGMVIFMENMPENFDPLKDMNIFQHTPHVAIYTIGSKSSASAKTTIEIAYSKS